MPFEPVSQGFRFAIRVSDLQATDYVLFTCKLCRARQKVPPWMFHAVLPSSYKLIDLQPRMRCRVCGSKGMSDWSIWRATPLLRPVEAR